MMARAHFVRADVGNIELLERQPVLSGDRLATNDRERIVLRDGLPLWVHVEDLALLLFAPPRYLGVEPWPAEKRS